MNAKIFYICSIMFSLTFMMAINGAFIYHFSDTSILEDQLAKMKIENEKAFLEIEMQEIEMQEFKTEIARVLPNFNNKPNHYLGRQLASVLGGASNPMIQQGLSQILLRNAKKAYAAKKFKIAKSKLIKYITKFPHSSHLPESYLMLVDIEFTKKNYSETLNYINQLVTAYPANELTANALLVLAEIMERQERLEDASDIYRTVIDSFSNKQIQKKARVSLRAIGLE